MKLIVLPKNPKVIRSKLIKKAKDVPRFEEVNVESCETTKFSWTQGQATRLLMVKVTSSSI